MALLKYETDGFYPSKLSQAKQNRYQIFPLCTQEVKSVNYSLEKSVPSPKINLKHLEWLIDIEKTYEDKNQAHEMFMKNYAKMFLNDKKSIDLDSICGPVTSKISKAALPAITSSMSHSTKRDDDRVQENDINKDKDISLSHDIKDHLDKIRVPRKKVDIETDAMLRKEQSLNRLGILIRKYPFERNETENNEIYDILMMVDEFRELFPAYIVENEILMKKLCAYAVLETVSFADTPVLGNMAFYLVLKGSVRPLSRPHLNRYQMRLRTVTPEPLPNTRDIQVGECFGTITELKDRQLTTRMLRVLTLEDDCEFLKISVANFSKVKSKLENDDKINKYNGIKSCGAYSTWPKHTIEELMEFFEWRQYGVNTILTSEGYRCPFVAFINKGTCVVLRKVDVPYFNPKTKKKEKRMKQVVIGNLKENESFGEYSCAMKEPMHCSIVTETECKIGIIPCDKIASLDNITLRLILQTNNRLFADLSQDDLYKKHIDQEKKKEWKKFKALAVKNVIDKYGIVDGKGKHRYQDLNSVPNINDENKK